MNFCNISKTTARKSDNPFWLENTSRSRPKVEIPKDNGKTRKLGIPTAVDRVIQQAIAQVLTPIYEPKFAETSYGFRLKRSAHDALKKSREYLNAGKVWTVDMDLEKFFDIVNQSKLMEILARDIKDGRVLSLIHKYLRAGVVWCGRFEDTEVGVPQGGPLSPLCANIMLNELDHELERRGHRFVRYADDMVIFCGSKASAEQTWNTSSFYREETVSEGEPRENGSGICRKNKISGIWLLQRKERVCPASSRQIQGKDESKVRELTSRRTVNDYEKWKADLKRYVVGWVNYYKLADMGAYLQSIDEWMRRRIRMVFWKKWKIVRTRWRNLLKLGISNRNAGILANSRKGILADSIQPHTANSPLKPTVEKAGFQFFYSYYRKSVAA